MNKSLSKIKYSKLVKIKPFENLEKYIYINIYICCSTHIGIIILGQQILVIFMKMTFQGEIGLVVALKNIFLIHRQQKKSQTLSTVGNIALQNSKQIEIKIRLF